MPETQPTKSLWGEPGTDAYRAQARKHMRAYRETKKGRESARTANNKYRNEKRDNFNSSRRKWLASNPSALKGDRVSTLLRTAIKTRSRKSSVWEMIGTEPEPFKKHLESLWEPNMSWENFGSQWVIFLVIPKRAFDLTKPEEVRACFHCDNVKPVWKKGVLAKPEIYHRVFP